MIQNQKFKSSPRLFYWVWFSCIATLGAGCSNGESLSLADVVVEKISISVSGADSITMNVWGEYRATSAECDKVPRAFGLWGQSDAIPRNVLVPITLTTTEKGSFSGSAASSYPSKCNWAFHDFIIESKLNGFPMKRWGSHAHSPDERLTGTPVALSCAKLPESQYTVGSGALYCARAPVNEFETQYIITVIQEKQ